MANNKSAKKRIKLNKRNNIQNKRYKTTFRNLTKAFFQTLEVYKEFQKSEDEKKLKEILSSIYSIMDKGTKKNVFHKNMTARYKSRLSAYLKTATS